MAGFDLDGVLSAAALDVRRSFLRLFPLFLALGVGINLLNNALLFEPLLADELDATGLSIRMALAMSLAFFAFGIQLVLAGQLFRGGVLRFADALVQALRRFPVMLVVVLAYYLLVVAGTLLLIVPGVIAMVTLAYAWFLVMLDGSGPVRSLRDSFRFVWGEAWQVFGANLLWAFAYLAALGLLVFLLPGSLMELLAMLNGAIDYGDWRRWTFDALAATFGVIYVFLNLHILAALKNAHANRQAGPDAASAGA